ncbi:MAG: tetratricopeptide repeat protein [Candidatus Obscuribacterales bacterium]|nr:tetratricopeptide repeat protein [Candidatus Obscuribacterales bacterium]
MTFFQMTEFFRHKNTRKTLHQKVCLLAAFSLATLPLSFPAAVNAASSDYHFDQAVKYEFAGSPDAAIAEYRRGLQDAPQSVDGHTRLGTLLLDEQGDIDGAISEFVTALTIDPACKFCQARLDEAVDRKSEGVREGISRGNDFYRAGQMTRSVAAYRIAVAADPQDGEARNCLAWTLYRVGKLQEALADVQAALKLKVDEPEYINTLACVQFDLGQIDEALASWHKAIAKSKTPNPADLYGLAVGYLAKGDQASAIKNFKEAIKSDAKYKDPDYLRDKIGMSVHAVANHDKLLLISGEKDKPVEKSQDK